VAEPKVPQGVLDRLDAATDLAAVGEVVRTAARALAGAMGATFVIREGEFCFYADEDAVAPLWKGQRFPIDTCLSGWAMLHRSTTVVPDIEIDPRIPLDAYRPTFVRSLAMVPVGSPDPVAAIGAYWSVARTPDPEAVHRLEALAAATGAVIDRIGLADAPWAPSLHVRSRATA
jgi:two-component system CheB/CheR fusion protein